MEMLKFEKLSIMMGAVTETDSLRETVKTILDFCDAEDLCEIIICYADRATPETMQVIRELESEQDKVPIVAIQQKRPFMGCINDAIDISRGSHCMLVASDGALDLTVIPQLIEKAKLEPEAIHSLSRWMKGCRFYGYGRFRKILNFCAQKFLAVLYMRKLTDFTIPVQIAPTELYKSIRFEETGFPILIEMVLKPIRLGYKFTETPTNCYSRKEGKSSNSTKQTFSYLRVALHIRFMSKEDILLTGKE
ncbi:MAG: glycosyltransferase [Clostridia bacterium]|nr:glycosyltransferase [Clostridia bacterium]